MKPILSIQGGGIRGILPACALVELEKQTGKLARECFAFIGGSSTGALLSAAIAAGVPAQKSLEIYLAQGHRIFSPVSGISRKANLITQGRQFDSAVLHQVFQVALQLNGDAGCIDWTINHCPIPILITATDVWGDSLYFTQDRTQNACEFGKYSLIDAAVASACATTFHDPWRVEGLGPCADGGCSSLADPVYQVCVEAFAGAKCYGAIDPSKARVISLGTGSYRSAITPQPPGSLLSRISWVTSALIGSSKTLAAQTVERHWPGVLQVINPALPADIDEADVDYIPVLLELGQAVAAKIDWLSILEGGSPH